MLCASCSKTDQVITMRIPQAEIFNLMTSSNFYLINSKILKPMFAGVFLIDITTFATDGTTIIESYSVTLTISPDQPTAFSYSLIGKGNGNIGIMKLDFTPKLGIPAGIQQATQTDIKGIIRINFNSWDPNLGTTSNIKVPCTSMFGVLPLDGMSLECYYYYSASSKYIEVRNFQQLSAGTICRMYIPFLKTVAGGSITLDLIKKYNRVDIILNSQSSSYGTTGAATATQEIASRPTPSRPPRSPMSSMSTSTWICPTPSSLATTS